MKRAYPTILILLLIALSFLRENFFLVLNGAIMRGNSYKANIEIPEFLLTDFTIGELTKIKYVATAVFIALFSIVFILAVYQFFKLRKIRLIALGILITFIILAGTSLLTYFLSDNYFFYNQFIKISHTIQSPILTFLTLPLLYFLSGKLSIKD